MTMKITLFLITIVGFAMASPVFSTPGTTSAKISCKDSSVTCVLAEYRCDKWYDKPDLCMSSTLITQKVLGSTTWGNYYCGCDTKCHTDDDWGSTDWGLLANRCQSKFGSLPQGEGNNFWSWTFADKVIEASGQGKCCGGFCVWPFGPAC
jgi:hypothetical protein